MSLEFGSAIALVCAIGLAATTFADSPRSADFELAPGLRARNVEDPFDYFANSWALIGLMDYPNGTRITPSGALLLDGGLQCQPLVGTALAPLSAAVKKTLRGGHLPIVQQRFVLNDELRYEVEIVACPLRGDAAAWSWPTDDSFLNLLRATITNATARPTLAVFGLAWTPKEGELPLATHDAAGRRLNVTSNGALLAVLALPEGARVALDGRRVRIEVELASGVSAAIVASVPWQPLGDPPAEVRDRLRAADFEASAKQSTAYWDRLLGRGAGLRVPEAKAQETYQASLVYEFVGRDRGELHAGEGFYDALYLRDGAYQAISLAHAGYLTECRESLEFFLKAQHENGQFWTQPGELDANGYAVWALVEYYRISGDRAWLERVYPAIQRSVAWIRDQRRTVQDASNPFYGVLPAAQADGEFLWDGKHHILGYDWWNLRAVQMATLAAQALGRSADEAAYATEFADYRQCILQAVERSQAPFYPPSYEKAGTHWGNLEAVFPTRLIPPDDPRLGATLRHVRQVFGAPATASAPADALLPPPRGYVEGCLQWSPGQHHPPAIHPYLTQFVTNSYIIRGEQDLAIDAFYAFLLHTTSTHGFPEGVHYQQREAWGDTVPHLWAAALYITTLRNMLVREADGEGSFGTPAELHLLSAVPAAWLAEGKEVELRNAPTWFGPTSMRVTAARDTLRLEIAPPLRTPPARIVVHVPPSLTVESANLDGGALPVLNRGEVSLPRRPAAERMVLTVRIRRESAGSDRSFEAAVAAFEAQAPRAAAK